MLANLGHLCVRVQHEHIPTHHCAVLHQNRTGSYCPVGSWVCSIYAVPDPGHPEHGPQARGQVEDGVGSVHPGSAAHPCAHVQVLLLHTLLT